MSKAEINKSMINLLSFNNLSEMIINSCPSIVKTLCGRDLFIQEEHIQLLIFLERVSKNNGHIMS